MTLTDNLEALESFLPELKHERALGPLQNDIYEAIDDLCHLGRRAVGADTRVNYPARAGSEQAQLKNLRDIISSSSDKENTRYLPLLGWAEQLIQQIAQIPIPSDGHLGVLRTIQRHFHFLFGQYGFATTDEQPTGVRLTCGDVVIELSFATQSSLSFSMRRGDLGDFWIEDLLFLHGDQRYQSIPQALRLNTANEVDDWFKFISDILRQYGDALLRDQPGAFDRLAQAQFQRDSEYAAKMNALYG